MFRINQKIVRLMSITAIVVLLGTMSPINVYFVYGVDTFGFDGAVTDSTGGSDPFGSIAGTGNEVPTKDAFVRAMEKAFNLKEFSIDGVAFSIVNQIIERMSASIVDWINSGFEGKPAFVQDLKGYFNDLEGQVLGSYLNELGVGFLCSPFANKIKRSLQIQYAISQSGGRNAKEALFRRANQCTLDDVLSSLNTTVEQFTNDFSRGGWPAWLTMTQSRNNEIGAYLIVRNELFRRQGETVKYAEEELGFGRGFLSWKKKCGYYDTPNQGAPSADDGVDNDDIFSGECLDPTEGQIQTPGSVIEKQLNDALGSGERRLEIADEMNEIISALLNQLMTQALGGVGGLFGASQSGAGRTTYTDDLRTNDEDITNTRRELARNINESINDINRVINIMQISATEINQTLVKLEELNQCLLNLRSSGRSFPSGEQNYTENKTFLENTRTNITLDIAELTRIRNILSGMAQRLSQNISIQEVESIARQYINAIGPLSQINDSSQAELALIDLRARITAIEDETSDDLNRCRSIDSGFNFGF